MTQNEMLFPAPIVGALTRSPLAALVALPLGFVNGAARRRATIDRAATQRAERLRLELYTVNQEYQAKVQELSELNGDLDNLLRSTESGTLFLDEALCVRRFTPALAPLINMIPQDVGRSVEHFAFKFQAPGLIDDLRRTLRTGRPHERSATLSDGHRYMVRIHPFVAGAGRGVVVSFIDVTAALREQERLQVIIDSLPHPVAVLDARGRTALANHGWRALADASEPVADADDLAVMVNTAGARGEAALALTDGLRAVLSGERDRFSLEYPGGSAPDERWYELVAVGLVEPFEGVVISRTAVSRRCTDEGAEGPEGAGPPT